MKYLFFIFFFITCQSNEQCRNEFHSIDPLIKFEPPAFEKFPVNNLYSGSNAKIDLTSNPIAKRFRTRIRGTYEAEGLNFAGHYCFVYWGCGSPCKMSAVVDLKTGKVYNGPVGTIDYTFRKNSSLLILNYPYAHEFYNNNKEGYYRQDCLWCVPEIWVWNEEKKFFERHEPFGLRPCIPLEEDL